MTIRRRRACRSIKINVEPSGYVPQTAAARPAPPPVTPAYHATPQETKKHSVESSLPLAVILEILAREYEESGQGEALCRVALRLAEESGAIENYRKRWDEEETNLSGRFSMLLYDRNQCLELIRYHKNKGNKDALQRESDKLRLIEGKLLLGTSSPVRITDEDLELLEQYIKECGF